MRRVMVVVLALVGASCVTGPTVLSATTTMVSRSVPPSAPPEPTSSTPLQPTPTSVPDDRHVTVYFLLDDVGEVNRPGPSLVPVDRIASDDGLASALDVLLEGPMGEEREAVPAMSSAVPTGTELLGVSVVDGVATVDLSAGFGLGGGSFSVMGRLAQVVFTATRYGDVDSVTFRLDGEPVTTFSGEGLDLEGAQTRADYLDFVPTIFVDHPTYGGVLGNPAHLEGMAAVFEATFQAAITDADGLIIVEPPHLMTTSGVGWGTFDAAIPYDVDKAQWGSLIVWEDSARDGSQIDVR
ncbi:MAG TPA: spore gernimation protein [Actinobacteria bacterium]|nr:sporulation and spore germination [bacterium BMS3Bbin01]HDH26494.1 spore gernimation protein [Actinomycetota bacterium]